MPPRALMYPIMFLAVRVVPVPEEQTRRQRASARVSGLMDMANHATCALPGPSSAPSSEHRGENRQVRRPEARVSSLIIRLLAGGTGGTYGATLEGGNNIMLGEGGGMQVVQNPPKDFAACKISGPIFWPGPPAKLFWAIHNLSRKQCGGKCPFYILNYFICIYTCICIHIHAHNYI